MTGIPALLLGLGTVFFVFGLLSVFLLLAGAPTDLAWIISNFVIGVVLLVSAVVSNFDAIRERMASGEGRRIGRYGTSAVLQTVIALFIVGALAFFANRYHHRWDLSEAGVHSLSDQTQKVLEGLEQDVRVVAFYPKTEQPAIRSLLDKYHYASPRFQVEYADPNQRPDLIEKYAVAPEKLGEGLLYVAIGEESLELTEPDESKLTNAMLKLTRQGEKKVYFVTGHGERPPLGKDADGKEGFGQAADALRNENYQVETIHLETQADVPDDADVVILAGPTRPLRPGDADKLDRYLARGGSVLAMVDPRAQTDLGDTLAAWGVELGDDAIVDRLQSLFGQAMSPLAGQYGDHPITREMREVTLFPMARSVRPRAPADGEGAPGRFVELVRTGDNAWAERDLDSLFGDGTAELGPDDLPGPVALAVAGRPQTASAPPAAADGDDAPATPPEPRLVVFGDSDFAANQAIGAYRNRDLFVNSVNWLLGDEEAISIRPNQSRASRLLLSTEQLSQIRYVALFLLPQGIAIIGVLAWWSRRRAPGR
ncbi:Gldg family protein [Myxococcota bacterium]|nr:Gldg family protein [Myxococcota bacterium]MCZ7619989.1 GldG family protein [Myxococcota bacterium]